MWYVYILECGYGKLYTGITNDLLKRARVHLAGKGGKFTRAFKAKKLLFSESVCSKSEALRREMQIKRWPRKKKLVLIKNSIRKS